MDKKPKFTPRERVGVVSLVLWIISYVAVLNWIYTTY
jgi:hypothetical protein